MIVNTFKKLFFIPLGMLSFTWDTVYRLRRAFYHMGIMPSTNFDLPIISVGNLTFGGTGKTPLIIWLAEVFNQKDLSVAVLTRGYKGKLEKEVGIIQGGAKFVKSTILYGDEPILISKRIKNGAVIVGKKRSSNLKKYFNNILPDVVLLDDGYQHLQIKRDCNLALFDAGLPIERYKTAPRGYLREGLTAINDADMILITRADQVGPEQINELKKLISEYTDQEIPTALIKYKFMGVYNSQNQKIFEPGELKGKNVLILSAIASPESFTYSLKELEVEIVGKYFFPDHYFFKAQDIDQIVQEAKDKDAIILCSEKDMVKIKMITQSENIFYLPITVEFVQGEQEFKNILAEKTGIQL